MKLLLTEAEAVQTGGDGVHAALIPIWNWVGQTAGQAVGQTGCRSLLKPGGC